MRHNALLLEVYEGPGPAASLLVSYPLDGAPLANRPPAFPVEYAVRRICVDAATTRAAYLDGGEALDGDVPVATDGDGDGDSLTYELGTADPERFYPMFGFGTIPPALVVSGVGADDAAGLDVGRYTPWF